MPNLDGMIFDSTNGTPIDGATVKLWESAAFPGAPPSKDTPLPAAGFQVGGAVLSGPSHGSTGAYRFTGVAVGDYWVSAEVGGEIGWESRQVSTASHTDLQNLADDSHTNYQKESERGVANGYASLDAATKVPIAQVPTGTTSSTVSLGDHSHAAVGCGIYHNTTQSTTANVEVALQFNAEDWDSDAFHDPATNNTRVTIPVGKSGTYHFRGYAFSGIVDLKQLRWRKNGTTFLRGTNVFNNGAAIESSVTCKLVAGDYIEAMFTNGTSANIGHASAPEAQTTLTATYLGS